MTKELLKSTLAELSLAENSTSIIGIKRGIERETLRINNQGRLSSLPHPKKIGSALTHKYITTDFAESLLEFITPATDSAERTLNQLRDIQKYTQARLDNEVLWPMSMPCFIKNQNEIALAQYGSSNVGQMKTLYREGLKNRYGSMMQAIAGVHFNISFPKSFWNRLQVIKGDKTDSQSFISNGYLGLIRNFKRDLWLISYLFGASPALCSSFLEGKESRLPFEKLGKGSLYLPFGTALRLGDLGYTNSAQSALKVTYNSLEEYIIGLKRAISTDSDLYRTIETHSDGSLKQLNSNILQIENEFYSPIRPKRNALAGETPIDALTRDGIEYVEVRALDVNPFSDTGISLQQVYFLDVFLLYCLLNDSPEMDNEEQKISQKNLEQVVNFGRDPSLELIKKGASIPLRKWGEETFEQLALIANWLDTAHGTTHYKTAISELNLCIEDSDKTLSGQYMSALKNSGLDNGCFALELAKQYQVKTQEHQYLELSESDLNNESAHSFVKQKEIENSDEVTFDEFLTAYFK
ncbi:glutamate--cysteine ligase [Pseudoalteromonas denitrificans]|uniref:Glutamate--cysteine ligase n=1 Tax=Pseudoalteromonas denitrificans DSM 6059 TaxID=1123010 RepID=A0A1I1MLL3_9GAMM|nr:glutamate--cysteine ligase [Pseudoalteromonas denitrificans]SFC85976.1 glutamate-cysteine ligase [Pseudoalteromonas denitrificans DSM 6059]